MEITTAHGLPWDRLVRLHHEIARRAEQSFFSLTGEVNIERWTSLTDFEPTSLPGGWRLPISALASDAFTRAARQGTHSAVYLGGPGYFATERVDGRWVARWRPMLYREVELEFDETSLSIVPRHAYWQLNPLLYTALDRLNLRVEGDAELAQQLVEGATALCASEAIGVGAALKAVFRRRVPEINAEIDRPVGPRHFAVPPSEWMLFAPTQQFSALTRNLNQDYTRLEQRLANHAQEIGGLRLLEPAVFTEEANPPSVQPIVPLNASQKAAVAAALGAAPVTVISGPPGCGKSQVVVSILLNCWAEGRSVLFASNNNKAVDVVRERLKRFEDEVEITVRAGNQQANHIVPTLKRILQRAQTARRPSPAATPAKVAELRTHLTQERDELKASLASRIPTRLEERFSAALSAYSESLRLLQSVPTLRQCVLDERRALGLAALDPEEIRAAHARAQVWLARLEDYQEEERRTVAQRLQIEAELAVLHAQSQSHLLTLGAAAGERVAAQTLVEGPEPAAITVWAEEARSLFDRLSEEDLEPIEWDPAYTRWADFDDADRWAQRAELLVSQLATILQAETSTVRDLQATDQALQQALEAAVDAGLPRDIRCDILTPTRWLDAWADYNQLPHRRSDFLPWSARQAARARLKGIESQLRSLLPAEIWILLGPLDDVARERLAALMAPLRRLAIAQAADRDRSAERDRVEQTFGFLRAEAEALQMEAVPSDWVLDPWRALLQRTPSRLREARSAARAWRRLEARHRAVEAVRRVGTSWLNVAAGSPVKEAWCAGPGSALHASMTLLAQSQTLDAVRTARSEFHRQSLTYLIAPWEQLRVRSAEILASQRELALLPTRLTLLQAWLRERPTPDILPPYTQADWPAPDAIGRMQQHLAQIGEWVARWDTCQTVTVPEVEAKGTAERARAGSDLRAAAALLPIATDRAELAAKIDSLLADVAPWPVEWLTRHFQSYRPAAVRALLASRESKLESLAFDEARQAWHERLRTDVDAIQAVDRLVNFYTQQFGQLRTEQGTLFRQALRVAPVWITTAQASQAIPLESDLFDVIVIDEASQCTVTNLLPLVYRGRKLVVIGDEHQLPAIPSVQRSEEEVLGRQYGVSEYLDSVGHAMVNVFSSAIETLPRRRGDVQTLLEHFRSHPLIIGFSNREIYHGQLQLRREISTADDDNFDGGVHRIAVRGRAERGAQGSSWCNLIEGERVIEIVQQVRENSPHRSIGIVTPFASQKQWLRDRLEELDLGLAVAVDTAYGFQGDERDVIIFSAVAAPGMTDAAVRWIENPPNMINVAVTRARDALFVVADFEFCQRQAGILKKLALYCRDVQILRDTSPAELALYSRMLVEGLEPTIHPRVGGHEVDFVLNGARGIRLAVEVDGRAFHDSTQTVDAGIDAALASHGYQVLRVSAREVFETPIEVVHRIRQALSG